MGKTGLFFVLAFCSLYQNPVQAAKKIESKPVTFQQQQVILHSEAAKFSYQEPHKTIEGKQYYVGPHSGIEYEVVNEFVSDSGKYRAIALMDKNKNLYMSYRGTKGMGDLRSDLIIGVNNPLSKIKKLTGIDLTIDNSLKKNADRSVKFYDDTLKKMQDQKMNYKKPVIVGHSLGGFMAQMVGHQRGAETHSFNAPGAKIENYFDQNGHIDNITNHVRSTDVISNWGKHIGKVALYSNSAKDGGLFTFAKDQHKLDYLTNDFKRGMTPKIYEHGLK